jgi:glycosyltransferase involved in cell wall biosynthesis
LPQVFLSIVIPVYNEESRISSTLDRVAGFLSARTYAWEVVVADDGSTDTTAHLVGQFAARHPNVHLLSLPHRGKGWGVKHGMLAATGQYRLLCDADLSVPIEQVERLLPPQSEGADVTVGSREAAGSRRIGEPGRRHLMGRIYNALVRFLAVPGLKDTQCGFKCFRGEAVSNLFQGLTLDGFAFDVEVLFLARRTGLVVREIGVDWYYRERSKVRPIRDSMSMTYDLLKLRWRYRRGRHGHAGGGESSDKAGR